MQQHEVLEASGAWNSLTRQLNDLDAQMNIVAVRAQELGMNLDAAISVEHHRRAQELVHQDRLRRHAALEAIGAWTSLDRAINDLNAQLNLAAIEANRLGYGAETIHRQFALGVRELQQQDRLRRHANLEVIGLWSPLQRALGDLDAQMQLARVEAERLGYSTAFVAREQGRLAQEIIRQHEAQVDALALSITSPFEQMLDPLREFGRELSIGNLNPSQQFQAAAEEFRRVAAAAQAGDLAAIGRFQGAAQDFISRAEGFNASVGGVAARTEVQTALQNVTGQIEAAQRQASAGIEDAIRVAQQRNQDKLSEVVQELQLVKEEIKRLRR
jgi:hypothetical protein